MTIKSLRNDALIVCEVEVYSERRGTFFVDAYDNNGDNGGCDDPQLCTCRV